MRWAIGGCLARSKLYSFWLCMRRRSPSVTGGCRNSAMGRWSGSGEALLIGRTRSFCASGPLHAGIYLKGLANKGTPPSWPSPAVAGGRNQPAAARCLVLVAVYKVERHTLKVVPCTREVACHFTRAAGTRSIRVTVDASILAREYRSGKYSPDNHIGARSR